jgi:protein gp37
MARTEIEWADISLNPGIYGCSIASPACEHCYAATMAHRQHAMGNYPLVTAKRGTKGIHWSGEVRVDFDAIAPAFAKLPKKKPARVFVTSMADLFHADVPDKFIDAVFHEMWERPHLIFQVLTKRPERIAPWLDGRGKGKRTWGLVPQWPANVWAGTTVEDQRRADERIPHLLRVPARVRFLSMEPLLEAVSLDRSHWVDCYDSDYGDGRELINPLRERKLHWVIAGGESGPKARPSHPAWFRSLRDQCAAAGVPFFFKQWGEWAPAPRGSEAERRYLDGGVKAGFFDQSGVWAGFNNQGRAPFLARVGRSAAGRLLDGVEHSAFPESP